MLNKYKVIGIILIFFVTCSEYKEPVLKIGRNLDKSTMEITEETNTFTIYHNLAYILNHQTPFYTDVITRRFYKGKVYIDMIQRESVDINIEPGTKQISGVIYLGTLARKYGTGHFMILFIINDIVIAKKAFVIKRPRYKTPVAETVVVPEKHEKSKKSEQPVNTESVIQKPPEINKPLSPSLSPSEMMNE